MTSPAPFEPEDKKLAMELCEILDRHDAQEACNCDERDQPTLINELLAFVLSRIQQAVEAERENAAGYLDYLAQEAYGTSIWKEVPEDKKAKDSVAADLLRNMLPRFAQAIREGREYPAIRARGRL